MPILDLCAESRLSRFCFGDPRLITDANTVYSGDAAIDQLAAMVEGKGLLLELPGFNNSDQNAEASFATIGRNLDLRKMYDGVVKLGVLWPGRTAAGYCLAEPSARAAADRLRVIFQKFKPAFIDVEAHSLGNLIMLHANRDGAFGVRNMISCNAAVGASALQPDQGYFTAVNSIKGKCLLVYSRNDEVLGRDYRWMGSIPRTVWSWIKTKTKVGGLGEQALGFSGPANPELVPGNVRLCDATSWCLSHGGARDRAELYDAWQAIL